MERVTFVLVPDEVQNACFIEDGFEISDPCDVLVDEDFFHGERFTEVLRCVFLLLVPHLESSSRALS